MAKYLGVSTPAVSKWENGSSYPDITLFPILARVLKVDVNTLLSFNEDLTELEIRNFAKNLTKMIAEDGFEVAFKVAMDKVSDYPTCEQLIFMVAFLLDSSSVIFVVKNKEQYQAKIEEFRNFSIFVLIDKYMEQKNMKE